ncbi:ROK family transcriptional regulator [Cellulomonas xiejunii]|uniref:ROK family transcriptional regulator n=1 Tax=Cellulomonas xiejunii TaxID=2968083 RepID=UPI001D0F3E1F|nr:ROK family transcriptional regulator [Cellulomonas xiejunii]MCC2315024.1 ROK family transcriptional regulator [Cellulomonas xiejunii]
MESSRPARPSHTRVHNDRLALELLLARGPLTAPELVAGTGLSRPTIADLVGRLQRADLIEVVGEDDRARRGPRARLYGIAGRRAHVVGLDLRADGIHVAVSDLSGTVVAERAAPLEPATLDAITAALAVIDDAVDEVGADMPHTIAVGAPGLVDPATGLLRPRGEAAWHAELIDALRLRATTVLVENEANLAGIAELEAGAGRDTFVLLWLGDGVGAATVLDGALRRGASGGAGELGFLPVPGTAGRPSATDCGGGFHDLASGGAVRGLAARHGVTARDDGQAPRDRHGPAAPAALVRAAATGDAGPGGGAFLDALAANVALGAAAISAVLDPGCVILGGPVGRAGGTELAHRVSDHLRSLSPLPTEVLTSAVEGNEILRGAVQVALAATRGALFDGD